MEITLGSIPSVIFFAFKIDCGSIVKAISLGDDCSLSLSLSLSVSVRTNFLICYRSEYIYVIYRQALSNHFVHEYNGSARNSYSFTH